MTKSLLVTFHASHNYGSVLQSYATQKLLDYLGADNTILNFQMPSQKKYYSLYGGKGKMKLRQLAMFPIHMQRKRRCDKFFFFQQNYLNMTRELNTYDDLKKIDFESFDLFVSGSDQIWSNTIPEFVNSDIDYKGIYFGEFITCKKISFSSSTGEASEEYLETQKHNLLKFSHIAVREERGKKILDSLLDINCDVVLDPTLLLDKKVYEESFKLENPVIKGHYIFLYTLQGIKSGKKWKKMLIDLVKKTGLKVIVVSPFFPIVGHNIKNVNDAGPIDFLNLLRNADFVLTDSFHGTAFSAIFRKEFLVFQKEDNKDARKKNLLKQFGLSDRIISQKDANLVINSQKIDYNSVEEKMNQRIFESKEILRRYVDE